jgi:hypothetical protein
MTTIRLDDFTVARRCAMTGVVYAHQALERR